MDRPILIKIIITDYINEKIYEEMNLSSNLYLSNDKICSLVGNKREDKIEKIKLDLPYKYIYLCPLICSIYTFNKLTINNNMRYKSEIYFDDRLFINNLYKRSSLNNIKKSFSDIIKSEDYLPNYSNILENYDNSDKVGNILTKKKLAIFLKKVRPPIKWAIFF